MPSYRMEFSDVNGGGDSSSSIYKGGNGRKSSGCFVSNLMGFCLLLLAIIMAVGVGILVFFTQQKDVVCKFEGDNWADGGVADAVTKCKEYIEDGGASSSEICEACKLNTPSPATCPPTPTTTTSTQQPGVTTTTTTTTTTEAPSYPRDQYRLPTNVKPSHYNLRLQPHIYGTNASEFYFEGSVNITVECLEHTNKITLHTHMLEITQSDVSVAHANTGTPVNVASISQETEPQFFHIHLSTELQAGQNYSIRFTRFTGPLTTDGRGLYLSSYRDGDQTVYLATTQFEAPYARKAFPCFDEPQLKATFDTTLVRLSNGAGRNYITLSNMPVLSSESEGQWIADKFETTPITPTYLLAFIVCDYDALEDDILNIKYRTWARPNAIQYAARAQEHGLKVFNYFETKFRPLYSTVISKMDHIAIPDFNAGAMENWGLITYREGLLFKPGTASASDDDWIAEVIAHEITHMWFGNVVSPLWWDWLWLNEAFASFWDFHSIGEIYPSWRKTDVYVATGLHAVFASDALASSHPMSADVETREEISSIFDAVTYTKGAFVVRMMNFIMGQDNFISALNDYLDEMQFGNAEHKDLWRALDKTGETLNPKVNMTLRMDPWVTQMGYPVVTVTKQGNNLQLSQERFLLGSEDSTDDRYKDPPYNYQWEIPITYTTSQERNFDKTRADIKWLQKNSQLPIEIGQPEWYIVNVQQYGYFRVNYDEANWNALIQQLNSDHTVIHPINRAQIINDAWNLVKADRLDMSIALRVIDYLSNELDYVPWRAFAREMDYVELMLDRSILYSDLEAFMRESVSKPLQELSLEISGDMPPVDAYARSQIATYACSYGHPSCVNVAKQQFDSWKNTGTNSINPNLRYRFYCTAVENGGMAEWNFVYQQYKQEADASENARLRQALACTKEPSLLHRLLMMTMDTDEIRTQDLRATIENVAGNRWGRDIAFHFVVEHFEQLVGRMSASNMNRLIASITGHFNSDYHLSLLQNFENSADTSSFLPAINQARAQTEANRDWLGKHYDALSNWLTGQAGEGEKVDYRLPNHVVPEHYTVRLQPHIYGDDSSQFYFEGSVRIRVVCKMATSVITMHVDRLNIDTSDILVTEENGSVNLFETSSYEEVPHFYHLHLSQTLQVDQTYTIEFTNFSGSLTTDGNGLYLSYYRDGDRTVYLATTQMEPPYARKTFPCFDEPALKATFDITLVRKVDTDRNYTSIANAAYKDTKYILDASSPIWAEDNFKTTPVMPTYLLAFIVCDYKYLEDDTTSLPVIKYRTWARPNAIQWAERAQNYGLQLYHWFDTHFLPPYGNSSLEKLDSVAVPDFNFGAMENWGLVIYREAILYQPGVTTASYEMWMGRVTMHELAHMWFGNYISPLWWDYLWLNEGFATWWMHYGTDQVFPNWRCVDEWHSNSIYGVMDSDGLATSHPVESKVQSPAEINAIFDAVTYQKGGAVIGMMQFIMGNTSFIDALNLYLTTHTYGNAQTSDLWLALDAQMRRERRAENMTRRMDPWIRQMGYPVVTVTREGGRFRLTQKRFLIGSADSTDERYRDAPYNYQWDIPVTYMTSQNRTTDKNRYDIHWLEMNSDLNISDAAASENGSWILVNVDRMGYYRVQYDTANWHALIRQLNEDHTVFTPINRGQIINDAWNLAKAGMLDMSIALATVDFLQKETDLVPWRAFTRELGYVERMLERTSLFSDLKSYIHDAVNTPLNSLTLDIPDDMVPVDVFMRTLIAQYACTYDHPGCVNKAKRLFAEWKNTGVNGINPNMRRQFYCTAVAEGSTSDWEFVYQQFKSNDDTSELTNLRYALSCSRDQVLLRRLLSMAIDPDEIRTQDVASTIQYVAENPLGRDIAFQFFVDNFDTIGGLLDVLYFGRTLLSVSSHFNTDYNLQQLQQLASVRDVTVIQSAYNQALAQTRTNIAWLNDNYDALRDWLASRDATTPPPSAGSYRLPTTLKPYHYNLRLQPYIYNASAGFTFDGSTSIWFECVESTSVITLHQDRLTIDSSKIRVTPDNDDTNAITVTHITEEEQFHFYHIHLASPLTQGAKYVIHFEHFSGDLRRSGQGLYLSSYKDGDKTIYLATTQMEPTYARQVFPCFDEPALKATFNTTLVRRTDTGRNFISLSNMPNISSTVLGAAWTEDHFQQTMIMPTYLLAFIVCDYEYVSGKVANGAVESRVYARPNRIEEAWTAQNFSVELFDWFNERFEPRYETVISKVDHIAIPDFNAGAMENWGLITYRENLLHNRMTTASGYSWIAAVPSHELAHMWFGNKVSPLWWDYLWLNEAFADYFESYAVEQLYPSWRIRSEVDTAAGVFYAKLIDSYSTSHPLSNPVETPTEIRSQFDTITYTKGGAIIQMMHFIMGDHFIPALNVYLHNYLLGNANHTSLFSSLDEYCRNNGVNLDMTNIMEPWVTQMGYPVVTVTRQGNSLHLSQQRFLLGTAPASDVGQFGYKFEVPITWTDSVERNFSKTSGDIVFLTKDQDLTIPLTAEQADWYVVNMRHEGYYRVNYERENWERLVSQLHSDHTAIHPVNRGVLIDDAWNLVKAEVLDLEIALQILDYMSKEMDYAPWRAFARETDEMELLIERTGLFKSFQRYMQDLVEGPLKQLGFEEPGFGFPENNDPPIDAYVRTWVIGDACKYEHPLCVNTASRKVSDWQNGLGNDVNVNIRARFYCTAVNSGDHDVWDFIYSKYQEEEDSTEKSRLRSALGCSRDPTVLMTFLDMCLYDEEVPRSETESCISAVANNRYGRDVALNFVMEHFSELLRSFSSTTLSNIVNSVTQHFQSNFHLAQLQFLVDTYDTSGITSRINSVRQRTLTYMKWVEKNIPIVTKWLDDKVASGGPSERINYRLPTSIEPYHYNLELQPEIYSDNPEDFTFNGSVVIWITCREETNVITLHQYRQDFETIRNSVNLKYENGTDIGSWIDDTTYDVTRHFVRVHLLRNLTVGRNYILSMKFFGKMPNDGVGLYYSSYQEGGQTVYLATTKFEAPYARRAFPCFDEPALKATFNVTLVRRATYNGRSYNAKSNNERLHTYDWGNGYEADVFLTTLRSPTYLMAFIVSDFACLEDMTNTNPQVAYRTCARPNAYQHGRLAQDYGVWEFNWLEDHFEPRYDMPKLENMAIPDFLSGAMENWGLITYREGLLYEDGVSTAADKDWIVEVVAHELAHMWFGNIVSPKWWNWLWLNEAFASFWDFHLVEKLEPSWRMTDQFISQSSHAVMATDSLRSSHPLTADVESPSEIQAIFDSITYSKGAAIVRMMNFIMREDHFIGALNVYLLNRQYDVAEHQDLWYALDQYSTSHSLGLNMTDLMDPWVTQQNYPVVHVTWTNGQLRLTQERFLSSADSDAETDEAPYGFKWDIPITFATSANSNFNVSSGDIEWFYKTQEEKIIQNSSSIPDPNANNTWVIVNIEQYGYYRVNYDRRTWDRLIEQLNTDPSVFPPINRGQIINDAWSLAKAGKLDMDVALKTFDFLRSDPDYVPWRVMHRELGYIDDMLAHSAIYGLFKRYMVTLVNNTFYEMGMVNGPDEPIIDIFQRQRIVSYACQYGIRSCQESAVNQFRQWMQTPSTNNIDVDMRSIIYCNAIRAGDMYDWEFALEQYNATDSSSEEGNIRAALACTQQPWLLQRYLDLTLEPTIIRSQDVRSVIQAVSDNPIGRDMAWSFLKQNFNTLTAYMTPGSFNSMVSYLARYFNKESQMDDVRQYMEDNDITVAESAFRNVLESTTLNIEWMTKYYGPIEDFLRSKV